MAQIKSFNEALEAARRLFSNVTRDAEARELAVELRASGKLGLGVLRNYIGQVSSFSSERAVIVSTLLEGMSNDGLDMVPLLPVFLPLLTFPEPMLRDTVTDIICRLGEDSAIAENVALGLLRNPDPEIRHCGARILNAIAPWCGGALKSKLSDMIPLISDEAPTEALVRTAILRCRTSVERTTNIQDTRDAPLAGKGTPQGLFFPDLTGKRVFFVDDDLQIRNLMSKLLINAGAALQMATDGAEAIRMLEEMVQDMSPPNLAILDLRMPGENGMRVLEHLRRHFAADQTPVIILTAVKDTQIILTAMQKYEISSYLIKPVSINEFYMRVQQAFTPPPGSQEERMKAPLASL